MHVQGNSFQSIEIVNTKFYMDLLEKVRHLIEEEKYSTLAKLVKCALMSTESQLFEDLIATSKIQKDDPCLEVRGGYRLSQMTCTSHSTFSFIKLICRRI